MDFGTPIVSAAAALLGALGTQYLIGRRERLALSEERAWQMRKEARDVSHGVILAASTLNAKLSTLVQMVASFRAQGFEKNKLIEAFAEETEELQLDSTRLTDALLRFRLSFADSALVNCAAEVSGAADRMALNLPEFLSALSRGDDADAAAAAFLTHARDVVKAISNFDALAIARLAEPLNVARQGRSSRKPSSSRIYPAD